jgi:hypothetical protein
VHFIYLVFKRSCGGGGGSGGGGARGTAGFDLYVLIGKTGIARVFGFFIPSLPDWLL